MKTELKQAIGFREQWIRGEHTQAFRLLNGFTEGIPGIAIDIFAKTAVIHDYAKQEEECVDPGIIHDILREELPFLKAVILKKRAEKTPELRNGVLLSGVKPDDRITEHGVHYAIDLRMNQDNSFYADTRVLRKFLLEEMQGKDVLNTFAYTGSLGVAAAAGGAASVLQTDLSERFMDLAKRSFSMNKVYYNNKNFLAADFFPAMAKLKKEKRSFDCVILDPPFFSKTSKGEVDLCAAPQVPINKVRPLIRDNGLLIVVNNALYLSGKDFIACIDELCSDGCLVKEDMIPIPDDFRGPAPVYPVDPAPFNHPTKIIILRVKKRG